MNDNPSFNVEAISNGSQNRCHAIKGGFVKQGTHSLPQPAFTTDFAPGSLKELAGQLLGLVNGKGQPHQQSKDNR